VPIPPPRGHGPTHTVSKRYTGSTNTQGTVVPEHSAGADNFGLLSEHDALFVELDTALDELNEAMWPRQSA